MKNNYLISQIASLFDMYIDMAKRIVWNQDGPILITEGPRPGSPKYPKIVYLSMFHNVAHTYEK